MGGKSDFYLSKWYLDFIGPDGETFIFYAATLRWHGFEIRYTSKIEHKPGQATFEKSRFRNVQMPILENDLIRWSDPEFAADGLWRSLSEPIRARLFESQDGYLDWNCYQVNSEVELIFEGRKLKGDGYVEQLISTIFPWHLPMDELRWGRYGSYQNQLVWIEWKEKQNRQWLWMNNLPVIDGRISDNLIEMPHQDSKLLLKKVATLESEKKISSLISKISRFIPGIGNWIPLHFLVADEHKWISKGQIFQNNQLMDEGMAIHEYVDFRKSKQ